MSHLDRLIAERVEQIFKIKAKDAVERLIDGRHDQRRGIERIESGAPRRRHLVG